MANKKIIDLSKHRNKKLFKRIFKILRIPLVILVVCCALFLSARLLGNVAMSNVTDTVREVRTLFSKGEGYPHSLDSFEFRKVTAIGNKPLTVYKDSAKVLSSSAGEIFSMKLDSADSKVISKNGRALIYSNTSNKLILQSKTEKLGEIEEANAVVAAGLAKNGYIAASCATDEYQSVLNVYNTHFEKVFQWNCAQERISDIGLSKNGRNIVVTAVGAENAEIYTRIIIFNINSAEPKADLTYRGTLFLRVFFTDSNKIIAVGDNKAVVLDKNGDAVEELIYSEDSVVAVCADDAGNVLICHEEFGGSKTSVVRYSKNGRKTAQFTVDGTPDCFALSGGRIALSSGENITVYSSTGSESKKYEAEHTVTELFWCSGTLYTVENGCIYKC